MPVGFVSKDNAFSNECLFDLYGCAEVNSATRLKAD
jgi:hypothetical protein